MEVQRTLGGRGLLESGSGQAFAREVRQGGPSVEREQPVPVISKGPVVGDPLRWAVLIGRKVMIEGRAGMTYSPVFESQRLTHLRLTGLQPGLGLNCGKCLHQHGVQRVVAGLQPKRARRLR